jgi:exo-beta-1,3-glucanase (GH17 family)
MHFLRSSADLTKEEMAQTIDRFRMRSAEAGYDLPLATDQEWLRQIENMIEESRGWL